MKKAIKKKIKIIKSFFFRYLYGKIIIPKSLKNIENEVFSKKIVIQNKHHYKVYFIKLGRIFTNTVSDTAYIYKNFFIKEPSFQFRYNKKRQIINGRPELNEVFIFGTPYLKKKINSSVVSLLSGGAAKKNYWHWMFDVLPRIGILEKAKINIFNNFYLLPSINQKFHLETLLGLGLKLNKLINSEKNNHIEAHQIIGTDHPINFDNNPTKSILDLPTWIIKWLRKKYLKKKKFKLLNYSKIYIDRKSGINFEQRKINNCQEVKSYLIKKGFKIVYLEDLNFFHQVALFSNVKIIIGLHGAGLTNIIFSKTNTRVIEIRTKDSGDLYKNLALKCKLNYISLVEKNLSANLKYQNFKINVNIANLSKLL